MPPFCFKVPVFMSFSGILRDFFVFSPIAAPGYTLQLRKNARKIVFLDVFNAKLYPSLRFLGFDADSSTFPAISERSKNRMGFYGFSEKIVEKYGFCVEKMGLLG